MSDDGSEDLGERIARAKAASEPKQTKHEKQAETAVNAGGLALRHGTEMAASVLVGVVLGLGIDNFLGTKPWGFLIMLGFGLAAGVLGVIRAYQRINAEIAAQDAETSGDRD